MPKNDIWVGTAEAAELIGVTPRTLYKFIDEGDIPAYKFGRVIRLKRADVEAYIEGRRVQPGDLTHLYPGGGDHSDDHSAPPESDGSSGLKRLP